MMMSKVLACVAVIALCVPAGAPGRTPAPARRDGTTFRVELPKSVAAGPATGRLVVYVVGASSAISADEPPASGPFWNDPQPLFGVDVAGLAPGSEAVVDDSATSFPDVLSRLPAGDYRAQAVLDVALARSARRDEPGNLYSDEVAFTVPAGGPVTLVLSNVVEAAPLPDDGLVEIVEVRSALLSAFHGREVMLRAGVVAPIGREPGRAYPAVYEVPGFGGDHRGAYSVAGQRRRAVPGSPPDRLARAAYWIVLDPESQNGHTLFADSANNGPRGRALVEELVPALEARFGLEARPESRLLRGHSSGGWSVLWLATVYPEVFGAAWSSSPDPVDFHRFQLVNLYDRASLYRPERGEEASPDDPAGQDTPSYRTDSGPLMTVREENLMEHVLGPAFTSGQQWASWVAVFAPRDASGRPAQPWDPATGLIERAIADEMRAYDLTGRLAADPGRLGLIYQQRVRLYVGDRDNFYLNEAVTRLKDAVDALSFVHHPEGRNGFIMILPGFDHGTIFESPYVRRVPADMLAHLARSAPK